MNCPKCSDQMGIQKIEDVEIDICKKCSGIWFDQDELRKAKDKSDPDLNWMDFEIWKNEDKFNFSQMPIQCPKCSLDMVKIDYANTKVEIDERGFVKVNEQRRTTEPTIYAIGDVAGEPMLAHKASHEGKVAVEAIAGHKVAFEPQAIPAVVFTDPEIAWCGLTETQAKQEKRSVKVVRFPWGAS